jgi:thioredoxin-like negative regulator of GroEL
MIARALAIEGKVASPQLRRAHCYEMQGRYSEALQVYAVALARDPRNSRINLLLARVNIGMERFEAALAELQQVAPKAQGVAYHYLMGEVLEALEESAAAERHNATATALSGSRELAAASVLQLTGE